MSKTAQRVGDALFDGMTGGVYELSEPIDMGGDETSSLVLALDQKRGFTIPIIDKEVSVNRIVLVASHWEDGTPVPDLVIVLPPLAPCSTPEEALGSIGYGV